MWNLNSLLKLDNSILDGVVLPSGMNVDLCKSSIIMKCGLLQPIYGEPEVFKSMVETWFTAKSWNIEHLWKMCEQEYNPIYNFDRHEDNNATVNSESSSSKDSDFTSNEDKSDKRTTSGNDTTTSHDADTTNTTTENTVAAFNSAEYQTKDKAVVNGHAETNGNTTLEIDRAEGIDSTSERKDSASESSTNKGKDTTVESKHMYGNIGTTTTQQMMNAEIKLMGTFNIYDWIANMFESDLFITVY